MNKITLVSPYYNSPELIKEQIIIWESYSDIVKQNLTIILVDDGSEKEAKNYINIDLIRDNNVDFRLYRILENKGWNSYGANNLGICMADTKWILRVDLDWIIPNNVMESIINNQTLSYNDKKMYKFNAVYHNTDEKVECGPNIFLIPKWLFWVVGGYDEDFSGNYGWADILFLYLLEVKHKVLPEFLDNLCIEAVLGGSTHELSRDNKFNKEIYTEKRAGERSLSKDCLRFNWEQIT